MMLVSGAVVACAAALAGGRERRRGRSTPRPEQMSRAERIDVCARISRHAESAADLLRHWPSNESGSGSGSGLEWFVGRMLFDSSPSALGDDPEFRECVERMRGLLGRRLPDGEESLDDHSGRFSPCKPLRLASAAYAAVQLAIRTRCAVAMRRRGFSEMARGGTRYWRKGARGGGGGADGRPTAVFLHGLGVGLYPYAGFVDELSRSFDVIAFEMDHLTLSGRRASNVEAADDVCRILSARGGRFLLVGHSYGSVIASTIRKRHPGLVSGLVLMAPVCFLLFRGEIQSRFFDPRAPASQRLMARNPTIASAVEAGTVWQAGELWPDDARGTRFLVVLSDRDQLVPFRRTRKHLEDHYGLLPGHREVLCLDGRHGAPFLSGRGRVIEAVSAMFAPAAAAGG